MAEEVRSEPQRSSGRGLNDRNREEMEIRQQEEPALKILPQLSWLLSLGQRERAGGERGRQARVLE